MANQEQQRAQARLMAGVRWGLTDVDERRRDVRVAALKARIREVVDAAPPLTEDQCRELRALLVPGGAV